MKNLSTTILLVFLSATIAKSQMQLQWQKCLGGTGFKPGPECVSADPVFKGQLFLGFYNFLRFSVFVCGSCFLLLHNAVVYFKVIGYKIKKPLAGLSFSWS
jgi:hypothetical protein